MPPPTLMVALYILLYFFERVLLIAVADDLLDFCENSMHLIVF